MVSAAILQGHTDLRWISSASRQKLPTYTKQNKLNFSLPVSWCMQTLRSPWLPVQLQAFAHTIEIVWVQLKKNMIKMQLCAVHVQGSDII